ncbi:MAG: MGMT family protein [Defluviitaleaceae bacterium]|nr:MGMT family protein [Defluviitaleaceae bacterium]
MKQIPKGKVATYGQIARLCGSPKASRAVGYALHVNPEQENIPCHRVVNRFGGLAPSFIFGGVNAQRKLLENEGVVVGEDGIINIKEYGWDDSEGDILKTFGLF